MHVEIYDLAVISKKNRMKTGRGRVYKDSVVTRFERDLFDAIQSQWRGEMIENGDVAVRIEVTVPDKRRRDLQNFSDTICDVMNDLVYKDDSSSDEEGLWKEMVLEDTSGERYYNHCRTYDVSLC
jgi:Holliday junction resolvase RusA-like endonuclease